MKKIDSLTCPNKVNTNHHMQNINIWQSTFWQFLNVTNCIDWSSKKCLCAVLLCCTKICGLVLGRKLDTKSGIYSRSIFLMFSTLPSKSCHCFKLLKLGWKSLLTVSKTFLGIFFKISSIVQCVKAYPLITWPHKKYNLADTVS